MAVEAVQRAPMPAACQESIQEVGERVWCSKREKQEGPATQTLGKQVRSPLGCKTGHR